MTAVAEQPTKKAKKKADEMSSVDKMVAVAEGPKADPAPPPSPGEPGFPWQDEYPGEKVFTYTHDGVSVGLAAISPKRQPSIGFLRKTRKQPEFEQVLDMVEFIASEKALDIINEWVPTDLLSMFEEWSEWNRTNAGE